MAEMTDDSARKPAGDGAIANAGEDTVRGTSGTSAASLRRDTGASRGVHGTPRALSPRRFRGLVGLFVVLAIVFSAIPLSFDLRQHPNKDYDLWYQVGVVLRKGMDVYPDPASGRLFPFMYPPSAAAMLGYVSVLGKHGTALLLVLAHTAAWVAAIGLSIGLASGGRNSIRRAHPLLLIAPSLCIIALIHNTYLLGQPNLSLLALLLAAFACLRKGRETWAGVLIATGAAIKAFPILAVGYLVYRRKWKATAATIAALLAWLLVVPLPFRTPAQAMRDVAVWSRGMVFTYNAKGIAQRPYRSFSYKNQSIMAMGHRLLRDVPADGEKVLSEHAAAHRDELVRGSVRGGMNADGSIDLATMLATTTPAPRWDELMPGVNEKLGKAWRVNVLSLDFRTVTAVTLASILALSLFTIACWPGRDARTPLSDAVEFAQVTLLITIFSPLSFNYAFVWLIYPYTLALELALTRPAPGRWRTLERAWVAASLLIPGLAVFAPLYAQAYGNLFVPAVLLIVGLGLKLRSLDATRPLAPGMHQDAAAIHNAAELA
jgi:hypothetical protein